MINKRKIKLVKPVLAMGFIAIVLLTCTLFFADFFEKIFLLKPNSDYINSNSLEVHFVDVGQGDAILIRLPNNETMLVDAGPKNAENQLMDYIDKFFFRTKSKSKTTKETFNYVVLTHSDLDHSGNMLAILNRYNVENFYRPKIYSENVESEILESEPGFVRVNIDTYDELISKLNYLESANKTKIVFTTNELFLDFNSNFNINFLTPYLHTYSDINDFSPIMMVEYEDAKIMLTGDATTAIEIYVTNNYQEDYLDVDVLKLGHHGSNTSTSLDFLEVVKPEYAIVSAAKNNQYGHPHADVIDNVNYYSNKNSSSLIDNILSTAEMGNIVFYKNSNEKLSFVSISHSSNYYFISWWVVVLIGYGIVVFLTYKYGVKINTGRATR